MSQERVMEVSIKNGTSYTDPVPIGVLAENVVLDDGSVLQDNLNIYVFKDEGQRTWTNFNSLKKGRLNAERLMTSEEKDTIINKINEKRIIIIQFQDDVLKQRQPLLLGSNHFYIPMTTVKQDGVNSILRGVITCDGDMRYSSSKVRDIRFCFLNIEINLSEDKISYSFLDFRHATTNEAGFMSPQDYNLLHGTGKTSGDVRYFYSIDDTGDVNWHNQSEISYEAATSFNSAATEASDQDPANALLLKLNDQGQWAKQYSVNILDVTNNSKTGIIPRCNIVERKRGNGNYVFRSNGQWDRAVRMSDLLSTNTTPYIEHTPGSILENGILKVSSSDIQSAKTDPNYDGMTIAFKNSANSQNYRSVLDYTHIVFYFYMAGVGIVNNLIVPSGWFGGSTRIFVTNPLSQTCFTIFTSPPFQSGDNFNQASVLKIYPGLTPLSDHIDTIVNANDGIRIYGIY